MTADEKITEATFFLEKIRDNEDRFPDVSFYFSAFLSSTLSIRDHLLDEYINKFGLHIPLDLRKGLQNEFEIQANAKAHYGKNDDALKFFTWYKEEIGKIKSTTIGSILVDKRNINTHRQPVEVIPFLKIMFGSVMSDEEFDKYFEQQKEAFRLANPKYSSAVFHTEQLAYVAVVDFSKEILDAIKNLVSEAHKKFPNELSNVKF